MSFLLLGLSQGLCRHLANVNFTVPTPIQKLAIPKVMANCDLMASAQTGTGKTGSFLLPLIDFLTHARRRQRLPRLLILEPTRELALQVQEQFIKFSDDKLKSVLLVGGESNILQEKALHRGVDVIIATPGRFMDLYDRSKIMLNDIKTLVIDEADRMMDMGFIPDIDRVTKIIPSHRQTVLFSATFNEQIEALSAKYLTNPKRISTEEVNKAALTIEQFLCFCEGAEKKRHLLEAILKKHPDQQAIVFCNQKKDIVQLVSYLNRKKYNAVDLHGDLTQDQRTQRLEEFKKETYRLLIASDIAARGIDIPDLGVVINFDAPLQPEDYVHRIGRTGRAGSKGVSYLMSSQKKDRNVLRIQELIKEDITVLDIDYEPKVETIPQETKKRSKTTEMIKDIIGFGDFIPAFMLRTVPGFSS